MNLKADFFYGQILAVDKFAWQFLSFYRIFNVFNISHDIAFIAVEM